jgi:L-2,4-diaminobutyrate decarboxylase
VSDDGLASAELDRLIGDATAAGRAARRAALDAVADCLDEAAAARRGPYSGASPGELAELVAGLDLLPEVGTGLEAALRGLGALAVRHAVDPAHPAAAAHLHCAPLHAALAGELLAAATNPSLDSWDQAPIATHLEQRLVQVLAAEAGYHPATADGVLTSGGTQSNLMGLLLARDAAGRQLGGDVAAAGLGPEAARWRVLCSEAAHFSVQRAASLLGLGRQSVVAVATGPDGRLLPDALDATVRRLRSRGLAPIALVATAGTTDLGAIDPLPALADRARRQRLWLHVDAAVGGALLLSERHRARLEGLAAADSIAIDFHKLLWQPLARGLFLVRERGALAPLEVEVAYLNADSADERGDGDAAWRMPHLVGKSLATSRRFDALKVLLTFQALGRRTLGALLERALELAGTAADLIAAEPALALAQRPALNTVVFRYLPARDDPGDDPGRSDQLNAAIRTRLLADGTAVVGRTRLAGRVQLKLTLLNPLADRDDLAELIARVVRAGADLDEDRR